MSNKTIRQRYEEKFRESSARYEARKELIAGGSQEFGLDPFPVVIDSAKGALQWDVSGNELIDYFMGGTSLLLGHARPEVVDAISSQARHGTSFFAPSEQSSRWALALQNLFPGAERVRFTASGTITGLLAMLVARVYTRKNTIVKLQGHYLGYYVYSLINSNDPSELPRGVPPDRLSSFSVVEPDIAAVRELLRTNRDVAAIMLDLNDQGIQNQQEGPASYLAQLQEVADEQGVLLIFDECISGCRLSPGGAQALYGIKPDLTMLSKIIAGGLPGGALVGRANVMELFDEVIHHFSSLNGNPLTSVAGATTLDIISREPVNQQADKMAERLEAGLRKVCESEQTGITIDRCASIVRPVLSTGSWQDLFHAMLVHGVRIMPMCAVSAAHTEEHIDRTVEAFDKSVRDLHDEGLL